MCLLFLFRNIILDMFAVAVCRWHVRNWRHAPWCIQLLEGPAAARFLPARNATRWPPAPRRAAPGCRTKSIQSPDIYSRPMKATLSQLQIVHVHIFIHTYQIDGVVVYIVVPLSIHDRLQAAKATRSKHLLGKKTCVNGPSPVKDIDKYK